MRFCSRVIFTWNLKTSTPMMRLKCTYWESFPPLTRGHRVKEHYFNLWSVAVYREISSAMLNNKVSSEITYLDHWTVRVVMFQVSRSWCQLYRQMWYQVVVITVATKLASRQLLVFSELTHWGRMMHICVGNLTVIDSGRRQAIIRINDGILYWTLKNKVQWNFNRNSNSFIQENAFESIVCEVAAVLSRPQCVVVVVVNR